MELDYIWGLFVTDGSLYKERRNGKKVETKKRLKITLKQEEVIKGISDTLRNLGFTPKIFSEKYETGKGVQETIWSVRLNKQKEIEDFLKTKPKKITEQFLFGVIDGDGCFRYYNTHGNRKPLKQFLFHCSKSRKIRLFKQIEIFLKEKYNINCRGYEGKTYTLMITTDYNKFSKLCKGHTNVKKPV